MADGLKQNGHLSSQVNLKSVFEIHPIIAAVSLFIQKRYNKNLRDCEANRKYQFQKHKGKFQSRQVIEQVTGKNRSAKHAANKAQ